MADKRIKFIVTSEEQKALDGFNKVESKATQLNSTLGKLGVAFGAVEVVRFGYNALKLSAELDVLRSNFVGSAQDIELFRKATAGTVNDAGLIKLSNYASELNLTLKEQALAFSLAEDSADKFGGTVEEGFNKFVLASEGSKKAIKSLGISQAEYKKAIDEILKTTGYRIEQLDLESQAEVRKQAILKASGITIDEVNKKTQDNLDKIESLSTSWNKLETAIGSLLNSPIVIKFFELTGKAVEGWAFILGGGGGKGMASTNINSSKESDLELARTYTKMSADGLEINKRLVTQKMQEQTAIMAVNGAMSETYKTANAIAQRYQNELSIIKDIDKWKVKIAEMDNASPNKLKLSEEATNKIAEATKKRLDAMREIDILVNRMSSIINKSDTTRMDKKNADFIDRYYSFTDKGIKLKGVDVEKPKRLTEALDFDKGQQDLIDFVDTLTFSLTDTLQSGFSQAWENIFGEANSLVEQLLANLYNGLMNLAMSQASQKIFDFILSLIPGGGAVKGVGEIATSTGAFRMKNMQPGNTTTIIKLGDATLLKLVNGVLPDAYNNSVRYREIGALS